MVQLNPQSEPDMTRVRAVVRRHDLRLRESNRKHPSYLSLHQLRCSRVERRSTQAKARVEVFDLRAFSTEAEPSCGASRSQPADNRSPASGSGASEEVHE